MSIEGSLYAALAAQVETITGYTVIWPRKGGDQPAGDHLRISFVPNDNQLADLASQAMERQGFLYVTLVEDGGEYEVVSREKAGDIAETYFKTGARLTFTGGNLKITGHTVRPGRMEGGRWETPIRISYWSMS
ncbi:phage tail terminator-like protein [Maritimibacter sp. UBA3975]|uniref:phage tail terminator-like protein n=1 Tax=Maritimibacter sp. UBA3975 TaxID=1946833 RepID=UPI000C0B81E0|nr:phage tail terminator-like protein [Maritimibacter sp. UBA3975]MAM60862.1 hypothetical protein [Maritimibacter sp.]|tara:strand:+ start:14151 stop:14549 length:399 start_codon:yes stop_codon:yes gene_type:complete